MRKVVLFFAVYLSIGSLVKSFSQTSTPFYGEIQQFKKQDSLAFPARDQILFVGSSSFRLWNNLPAYFQGYRIINRGFGGSTLPDVIYYANDVIFPYAPKQVVIYCGDNDLASGDNITADSVVNRFARLFNMIRERLPQTKISYVAIKPSPSRIHLLEKMKAANSSIRTFIKQQNNASFIDIFSPMMSGGEIKEDLFLEDKLHMNEKGYRIWQKKIKRHLLK